MKNTNAKGKKQGKLSAQFNILIAIITTIIVTVMIIISGIVTRNNVNGELTHQTTVGTNLLAYELSLQENGSDEDKTLLLDRLKEITACEFTIFNGDVREFTTIVVDGQRAVGTVLDPTIADIVLNQGKTYNGEAEILGEKHITTYIPYTDETGEIVGVLFSGIISTANDDEISLALTVSMFVGIALIIIGCLIAKVIVDKVVAKPLEVVMNSAQRIAQGDMHFDLDVDVNNEIGLLAQSFNMMKYNLSTLNKELLSILERISNGEWNVSVDKPEMYIGDWDQLHKSLSKMVQSVHNALSQVSASAVQISSNITMVASGSQALAEGSINQASSVDNLSKNLNSISLQVDDNSKNAKKVNDIAVVSGEVTTSTLTDMNEMLKAMQEISNTSEDIEKVIKVIDDIAFQTNILALNAAVEAARAGTAGKGFAVVADEVRNLAQKSSEAVKNTSELIEHSISAVKTGETIAQKANTSFESLAEKVQQMVGTIDQIAKATQEQAEGIKEITTEIEQISVVVQTNTATSEESAAASQELSAQADTLHSLVEKFKL